MALKNNTWKINQWYDQAVAGNVSYTGAPAFYAMGENNYGQLGQNDKANRSAPIQIPGTIWDGENISITGNRSMARRTDGTLWSWGAAGFGKLGLNNESTDYSSPIQIPGTTWSSIMDMNTGDYVSGAFKTDGTLWMWGRNSYGALGQNETYSPSKKGYSSPVQIPGTTWSSGSCEDYISSAIKTDGTLWAWGYNEWGAMAQNNTSNDYSSPVQIPGTWSAVSAGSESIAIKTDGTLWTWGKNEYGQMGNNDGGIGKGLSSPTQIPGTTWQSGHGKFSAFTGSMGAVKSDGTLWMWGANDFGKLGINEGTPGRRSSPTQIPGTNWSAVEIGYMHSLATKTDGTLWSWGYNVWGGLGVNNRTKYSSPVQVPGSWKAQLTAGGYVSGVIGNI